MHPVCILWQADLQSHINHKHRPQHGFRNGHLHGAKQNVEQEYRIRKTWSSFKKLFAEEYHDLNKHEHMNANQAVFHGSGMGITMQDQIYEGLDNLVMSTTAEKDVLSHLTSTITQLSYTNNIVTDQVNKLTETGAQLTETDQKSRNAVGKQLQTMTKNQILD